MSDVDNTKPTVEEVAGAPTTPDSNPDAGTTPPEESTAFYKAQLEAKEKELAQAQYKLNQERLAKKEVPKEETPKTEETPSAGLSPEELDAYMEKKLAEKEATKFRESLPQLVEDDNVRAKVEYYLDNIVKPTGNPEADLSVALTLAQAEKTAVVNKELKRTLNTKAKGVDLPGTAPTEGANIPLSQADKKFLEAIGVDESTINPSE